MTMPGLQLAVVLALYAAFALFQSVARGQPLAVPLGHHFRHGRAAARLAAFVIVLGAAALLARATGWGEAALFVAVSLVLVASVFVPLAAVAPRLAWRAAIVAPVVAVVIGLLGGGGS
jgi:hypothetical protein